MRRSRDRSWSHPTPTDGGHDASHGRAQLSMPLIEAAVGVVLILALAGLLAVGTPSPQASDPQLDAYAADVATVLAEEPARHDGTTRLDEISRSPEQFDREAAALERRVDDLLPDNLLFRVEVRFADGSGADGSGTDDSGADGSGADGSGADGSGTDASGTDESEGGGSDAASVADRSLGFERPSGAVTGAATVTTSHGTVRIEVWYP